MPESLERLGLFSLTSRYKDVGFASEGRRAFVEKEDGPVELGRHDQIISQLEREKEKEER